METDRIRKNATKKIAALISQAKRIVYEGQAMGLDDCFSLNEPVNYTPEQVHQFIRDNYARLVIYYCEEKKVRIAAHKFHFANSIVLYL
jgi:hypothetical protein